MIPYFSLPRIKQKMESLMFPPLPVVVFQEDERIHKKLLFEQGILFKEGLELPNRGEDILLDLGYTKDFVLPDKEGLFLLRGDTLHIWPAQSIGAYRISFFDDKIEEISIRLPDGLWAWTGYQSKILEGKVFIAPVRK